MYERAADQDPAHFPGGHFADRLFRQPLRFEPFEHGVGALAHLPADFRARPDRGAGEKAGKNRVAPFRLERSFAGQIGFDHAEALAQLNHFPALAAEDAQPSARPRQRIALAG